MYSLVIYKCIFFMVHYIFKFLSKTFKHKMSRLMTKPTKWPVRPAKTQISLGIHPVWSESSLCAQWIAKDPKFLHADSEDSDQTGLMPRLIWVFAGAQSFCWFCHEAAQMYKICKWAGTYRNLSYRQTVKAQVSQPAHLHFFALPSHNP